MVVISFLSLFCLACGAGLFTLPLLLRAEHEDDAGFDGDTTEFLFLVFSFGLLWVGWLALIFTEIGRFSLWNLVAAVVALPLLLALFRFQPAWPLFVTKLKRIGWRSAGRYEMGLGPLRFSLSPRVEWVLLLIWAVAVSWLYFRPHQYIVGAADVGLYLNFAAHIVKTGGITIYHPVLEQLDPALYGPFLRQTAPREGGYLFWSSGFLLTEPTGRLMPHFYHLHSVWQAIVYGIGGVSSALMMTPVWGLLSNLAIYMTARRLFGRRFLSWAWVTLLAMSVTTLQVWFVRYGTTEAFTQFLFWLGAWGFICWVDTDYESDIWGLLAGMAWGMTFLARIDTFFVLIIPAVLIGLSIVTRTWRRSYLSFLIPLVILPAHSVLHALLFSRPYFLVTFGTVFRFANRYLFYLIGAALLGLFLLYLASRWRAVWPYLLHSLRWAGAVSFTLFFLYNRFLRPEWGEALAYVSGWENVASEIWNHENLVRLGWYLSEFGLWVAAFGVLLWIWRFDKKNWSVLVLGLVYFFLYVANLRNNGIHLYSQRRYVPVVLPFLMVASGYLFVQLQTLWGGRWHRMRWLIPLLGVVWLGSLLGRSFEYMPQVDRVGQPAQIASLAETFPENSILLFSQAESIGWGDFLGVPLFLMFDHYPLVLHDADQLDVDRFETALQQWEADGYALFWIALPGGPSWPLDAAALTPQDPVIIESEQLEEVVDRKPENLIPVVWRIQPFMIDMDQISPTE